MTYKRILTGSALLFTASILSAREIDIVPKPKQVERGEGSFTLNSDTPITYNSPELESQAEYVSRMTKALADLSLTVEHKEGRQPTKRSVNLILDAGLDTGEEGYVLSVSTDRIAVSAGTPRGVFFGVQSLLQLVPLDGDSEVPCVEIKDEPRFPWRGFHFDVSRHFRTLDELKLLIDQMAMYKFNIFHLHLTDDQGWRIEIESLPKLTEIGAWSVPRTGEWHRRQPAEPNEATTYGGFYTREELKDLIEYAAERQIQIMPEIDVPGHALAAIASYPDLSCTGLQYPIPVNHGRYGEDCNALCIGRESTFEFLDKVFDEVVALFPFEYIHIGGDECFRGFWEKCPECRKRMKDNGLKDEKELQSYFIKRIEKMLAAKGKKIVGWGEILDGGLAPGATVMSWIDMSAGVEAAKQGHDVIMTPRFPCYMDYYQGDRLAEPLAFRENRLTACYRLEPVADDVPPDLILGGQTCLWGEYTPNFRHAQYLFWPRSMALSEVFWSQRKDRDWNDFIARMEPQLRRFDKLDYNYAPSYLDAVVRPTLGENDTLQIWLGTEIEGLDIFYTFDNTFPDHHSPKYHEGEILEVPKNAHQIIVVTYRDGKKAGRIITFPLADLKARTQAKKDKGAPDFMFD